MASKQEKTNVEFYFNSKSKVQPKGFQELNLNEKVTVLVKGNLLSLSVDKNEWAPGKRFSLEITSCEVFGPEKKVSLEDAIQGAKTKV